MSTENKQKEANKLIIEEKLSIYVLIETHIKSHAMGRICDRVFGNWNWLSNSIYNPNGCKIIVGWNGDQVQVMIKESSYKQLKRNGKGRFMEFIVQEDINKNPHDDMVRKYATNVLNEYTEAVQNKEKLKNKSRIDAICDDFGNIFEGEKVAEQFVEHLKKFLGRSNSVQSTEQFEIVIPNTFNEAEANLMVKWVNIVKLIGRSVWDIKTGHSDSWGWKNLLMKRGRVRRHVFHEIGNGRNVWYDKWNEKGPLDQYISKEERYVERFAANLCVHDMIDKNRWNWPVNWYTKYPVLNEI
ncbi:hypothetical protein Tco_0453356 [Tanacetum coccineum]